MRPIDRPTNLKVRALAAVIAAALSLSAAGVSAQGKGNDKDKGKDKGGEVAAQQADDKGKGQGQGKNKSHGKSVDTRAHQEVSHDADRAAHHQAVERQQRAQADTVARQQDAIRARQADKRASQDAKHAQKAQAKATRRLAAAQQRQLITQQQARAAQNYQQMERQRTVSMQYAQALEAQRRLQQARYAQDYTQRLWQQQQTYRAAPVDYYNDPYFYSAPTYQYSALGRTYQTNEVGAEVLRDAINAGYREGLRAGRADQLDNWRPDYRSTPAYQQPYYGYNGYYLDQEQYAYYFRQGLQRGYEDGYYGRQQYGRTTNGTASIISTLLSSILNMRAY